MRMRLWIMLLVVTALAAPALAAQERILDYHSDVTVHQDGSLTVTETIKVRAERNKIKRGIYRDFPTLYRGSHFTRHWVPFEVVEVKRDGKPDGWHTKGLTNGTRVYMGREGHFLKPGEYTYTMTYKTDRQVGFFEDHDELYWNVTGNDWEFSIEKASATVHLPDSVPPDQIKLEGYTGPQGAKGQDFTSGRDEAGNPTFTTTRVLGGSEGLTIVVSWPKGHVTEPTGSDKLRYLLRDNAGIGIGLLGLILVFVYYLIAWFKVGQDPMKGTIIPLYEPPEGLSPAAMRYLMEMGYDDKCFAAAVIDMGVKGCVRIEEDEGEYTLHKLSDQTSELSSDERKVFSKLLKHRSSIEFKQSNHLAIQTAIRDLQKGLSAALAKTHFRTNRMYLIPAAALSVITLLGAGFMFASGGEGMAVFGFMCVWLSIWSIGVAALVANVFSEWRRVFTGAPAAIAGAIGITAFSIPFLAGEGFGLVVLTVATSVWMPFLVVVMLILNVVFYHLLKAPTRSGRRLMDKVEGFRMYLGTAERRRLDTMEGPEKTPELFEKYLPYALALGVENEWSEKFSDVLRRAAQEQGEYSPTWYHGAAWSTLGAGGFASSLGSTFATSVASSAAAPGSSSGSGGGGSSGGGGGGGGGGGW